MVDQQCRGSSLGRAVPVSLKSLGTTSRPWALGRGHESLCKELNRRVKRTGAFTIRKDVLFDSLHKSLWAYNTIRLTSILFWELTLQVPQRAPGLQGLILCIIVISQCREKTVNMSVMHVLVTRAII